MSNKLLVTFNTCGISGKENSDWYVECINNLLNQDFDDFHVVLSSCLNKEQDTNKVREAFGNKISYNLVNEVRTVNTTFNHSIQQCVKQFGEFEGFVYIDSGVNYEQQTDVLSKMYDLFKHGKYGMVYTAATTDNAFKTTNLNIDFPMKKHFVLPLGKGVNAHNIIFSQGLYHAYDRRVWPDIFASYCSESVFTFVCAAINKNVVIHKDLQVFHEASMDGASSGFPLESRFFHAVPGADLRAVITNPEAKACGLGYEECNRILMHDEGLYDGNQCKNTWRLKEFIRNNLFVGRHIIDYDNINHTFIPGAYK